MIRNVQNGNLIDVDTRGVYSKPKNNIRYVLYARRSMEKRDSEEKVASIESQLLEMQRIAEQQSLRIVKTFHETKSAKNPYRREQFQKMIEYIQNGHAEGILCWKVDRLARNAVDEGTIKYLLQTGIVKNIKASDRDWYPDDNVLMASVEFGVATQYSRDLAKHIGRGMKARCEAGVRPCYAPVGYKNSKYHEKGKEEILVDEERFPLVRKLFENALTGAYSGLELVKIANQDLGLTVRSIKHYPKRISKSNLYVILTNTFYYGQFEYPAKSGNWYQGGHKPIISKEEYDKLQNILHSKNRPRPSVNHFAYGGLLKCGVCGRSVCGLQRIKHQKNGNTHKYIYYSCIGRINCNQGLVIEHKLDSQVMEMLSKITIPKSLHDWAITTLKEMYEGSADSEANIAKAKKRQLQEVSDKLDSLLDLRLANELSPEEYQKKKSEFEQQQFNLQNFLTSYDNRVNAQMKDMEQAISFAEKAKLEFKNGDADKRRRIIAALGTERKLKDQQILIEIQKPLLYIQKVLETK